uniref:Uncharacterized protein n=1 Tax=Octopus bimaculoides TaxID=37653 RepID=A0A0L8FRW2_OCTBM
MLASRLTRRYTHLRTCMRTYTSLDAFSCLFSTVPNQSNVVTTFGIIILFQLYPHKFYSS